MQRIHDVEIAGGKDAFTAPSSTNTSTSTTIKPSENSVSSWSDDDDFVSRSIGEKNAGTDATYLPQNGNKIFESRSPVVSEEECRFIEIEQQQHQSER